MMSLRRMHRDDPTLSLRQLPLASSYPETVLTTATCARPNEFFSLLLDPLLATETLRAILLLPGSLDAHGAEAHDGSMMRDAELEERERTGLSRRTGRSSCRSSVSDPLGEELEEYPSADAGDAGDVVEKIRGDIHTRTRRLRMVLMTVALMLVLVTLVNASAVWTKAFGSVFVCLVTWALLALFTASVMWTKQHFLARWYSGPAAPARLSSQLMTVTHLGFGAFCLVASLTTAPEDFHGEHSETYWADKTLLVWFCTTPLLTLIFGIYSSTLADDASLPTLLMGGGVAQVIASHCLSLRSALRIAVALPSALPSALPAALPSDWLRIAVLSGTVFLGPRTHAPTPHGSLAARAP